MRLSHLLRRHTALCLAAVIGAACHSPAAFGQTIPQLAAAIQNQQLQINALQGQVTVLTAKVNTLQVTDAAQSAAITNLQATVAAQATTIAGLQAITTGQSTAITNLQATVNAQATTITAMQTKDATFATSIATLQTDVASLKAGNFSGNVTIAGNLNLGGDFNVGGSKVIDKTGAWVGAAPIADGSITTAKLADGAVTTAKLADGGVTSAKIVSVAGTKVTGSVPQADLERASPMVPSRRQNSRMEPSPVRRLRRWRGQR